jgi:hypothetical protein
MCCCGVRHRNLNVVNMPLGPGKHPFMKTPQYVFFFRLLPRVAVHRGNGSTMKSRLRAGGLEIRVSAFMSTPMKAEVQCAGQGIRLALGCCAT